MGVKGAQAGYQVTIKSAVVMTVRVVKLIILRAGEASGIPGVAVKCVDIGRNTSGEGGLLDCI